MAIRFSTKTRINLGLALLLLIVLLVGGASYRSITDLLDTSKRLSRTQDIISRLQTLQQLLTDAETGQRGYLLTGQESYLQPYHEAIASYDQDLAALRVLLAGEPEQQQLDALKPLAAAKFAELDETIHLRRTQGFDAAEAVVLAGRGQQQMAQLRAGISALQATESRRLSGRKNTANSSGQQTLGLIIAESSFALVLAAFLSIIVNRDFDARARVSARLEREYREADEARRRARAVLDATSEAIALVAPDGRLLAVNRRFQQFFDTAVVSSVSALPPEVAALLEVQDEEGHVGEELVLQEQPQRRELLRYSSPVMGATGVLLGRLYVFRDVTNEREVERVKSQFVSTVSHELRTPLTSIKGYVELILEGEAGGLAPLQQEFLEIVRHNANRLLLLINDLLDVSRIESGKLELRRAPLQLAPLVSAAVAILQPQLDAKRLQLSIELQQPLPPLLADEGRLAQILVNLLSNACKYTPAAGRITIIARAANDMLRIDVSDTGVGLTQAELQRLFTRFFRAENRATQEAGGAGLGLAITRSLVELHGGRIEVRSEPGVGSTFSVYLPLAPLAEDELRQRAAGSRPASLTPG